MNKTGGAEIYLGSPAATGEPGAVRTPNARFETGWDITPDSRSALINAGADLELGAPKPLLTVRDGITAGDFTVDGGRFLVTAGPNAQRDLRVILNWTTLHMH